MSTAHILVLIPMLLTLGVLIAGVVLMMKGGPTNAKYGNKLMVARVGFQGLTLLVIGALFLFGR